MLQPRLRGYGRSRLELPALVVEQILASDYANLVARKKSVRKTLFPQIVSLHTRRDLGAIDGLGPISIRKIEIWLARFDTRLRYPNESIDTVICGFKPRSLSRFEEQPTFLVVSEPKRQRRSASTENAASARFSTGRATPASVHAGLPVG